MFRVWVGVRSSQKRLRAGTGPLRLRVLCVDRKDKTRLHFPASNVQLTFAKIHGKQRHSPSHTEKYIQIKIYIYENGVDDETTCNCKFAQVSITRTWQVNKSQAKPNVRTNHCLKYEIKKQSRIFRLCLVFWNYLYWLYNQGYDYYYYYYFYNYYYYYNYY